MPNAHIFTGITSEGGILPADFLAALTDPKSGIEGLDPVTYRLAPGERIGDQVNRSWNRLKGCWVNLQRSISSKQPGEPTTTETRERWLYPLFHELDFGRLALARPIEVDGKSYPVSHGWGAVPIHLVGTHVDLDKRTPGAVGAAKASPHSLVQQVLNASDDHQWGIISNGFALRLIRDNVALTRMAYVEWDLQTIFDGDLYPEFYLLWLVCHQSRFEAPPDGRPGQCWLEKWKKEAEKKGLRALENLRPGVEKAIASIGAGLVSHKANQPLRSKLSSGQLTTQEFYRQILRIIYRMLFLFVAEDRGLLHPPLPGDDAGKDAIGAALKARKRYRDFYSMGRLRDLTLHRAGTPHPDLWQVFQLVSRFLGSDSGCAELAIPPLGSFLWSPEASPNLNDCLISNRHFLGAVLALGFIRDGNVRRAIDYKNLGSEELGSVYESLLELHPIVNADAGTFELQTAAGHERKTSGSYYTDDSLVQCLLDSTLEPVIAETIKGKEGAAAAEAILNLKICDLAVGSGHFLIGAGHRLARRVAAARTGEEEPSPEATRSALRDVIGRCLYGVDINPMAAELCRVSLWLEALEPGKPLSFLDHHIRVGNSLLGATPELIALGIPDDAFKAIEGDDKNACAVLKKRNKAERSGIGGLFVAEDKSNQEALRRTAFALEAIRDDTPEMVRRKAEAFEESQHSYDYLASKHLAEAWCAAFVIRKTFRPGTKEPIGITQRHLNDLAKGNPLPAELGLEVERLASRYRFFHWHLAFPEVFTQGGFGVVLGNPPWDKIQPEEEKFFASIRPDIANAESAKIRKDLIARLPMDDPLTHGRWVEHQRSIDGLCHFLKSSGAVRFAGEGNLNSYRVFTELSAWLLSPQGRAGLVVQTGLATDESGKELFDFLLSQRRLLRFLDFENRQVFFPDVHQQFRFSLVTIGGHAAGGMNEAAEFGWLLHSLEELNESERLVKLSASDLVLFNPSSRTGPVFTSARDLAVSRVVYQHGRHICIDESNRFGKIDFLGELFNMTRDSVYFTKERRDTTLPLYEAKFIHQFDHRYATMVNSNLEEMSSAAKASPNFFVIPKSYVEEEIVRSRSSKRGMQGRWMAGFRSIASATNERTAILSTFPFSGVGNSINLILGLSAVETALLMANGNAFVFDFCARQKISGSNVNIWIFKQLPAIAFGIYAQPCLWFSSSQTLRDWLLSRVLELTYTAWDLESFAQDCGWLGPPFRWDEERRFLLRTELDAAFFHLYLGQEDEWRRQPGTLTRAFPTPRHAVDYIMDTFPIVKRKDEEKHDEYRTKRVILEIYDEIAGAMRTGISYKTRLDPPAADPRVAHPPRRKPNAEE